MKRAYVLYLVAVFFLHGCATTAPTMKSTGRYGERPVEANNIKGATRYGDDYTQIICSISPRGQIIGVIWAIDNINEKMLDIKPYDVKLYDQNRELNRLEPAQVVDIEYGGQIHQPPSDPFSAMGYSLGKGMAGSPTRSQAVNDIYSSAFKFGQTNSKRFGGATYYSAYGVQKPLLAEITLDGETFKFEFE